MSFKILVTGGAGFIGSHIVLDLLSRGFDVIVIDNCINAIIEQYEELPESLKRVQSISGKKLVKFYQVDLKDFKGLRRIFDAHRGSISAVIHLAALKAVGESVHYPLRYYENNVVGTLNLVKCMEECGVDKLIFSSSATVYGKPAYLPIDEKHEAGRNITNPYGMSKYFTEKILMDEVSANDSLSVISLRYFNPVGAHESGEIGEDPRGIPNNLMPYISQVAIGRRPLLNIYGNDFDTKDGTGVRDYIHIMDLASGHVAALERILSQNKLGFEAINLGSGHGYSVLEMVEAFQKASGVKIKYKIAPRREGDVDAVYADCTKAHDILGWSAKHGIDRMCIDTWRWQSKNPHGFCSENNNNPSILP